MQKGAGGGIIKKNMKKTPPPVNKGGRPLFDGKDEKLIIAKLEEAWALGCSDVEAATFADISSSSLCRYLQANPTISERKAQLKTKPVLKARTTLLKAIDEGNGDLALKFLERKCRDEFATRTEVQEKSEIVVKTEADKKALEDAE